MVFSFNSYVLYNNAINISFITTTFVFNREKINNLDLIIILNLFHLNNNTINYFYKDADITFNNNCYFYKCESKKYEFL